MVLGYERGALDLTQPVGCTKIMLTENEKNKNSQPLRAIFLLKSVASSGTMQVSELQLALSSENSEFVFQHLPSVHSLKEFDLCEYMLHFLFLMCQSKVSFFHLICLSLVQNYANSM